MNVDVDNFDEGILDYDNLDIEECTEVNHHDDNPVEVSKVESKMKAVYASTLSMRCVPVVK